MKRVPAEYAGRRSGNYEGHDYDNQMFDVMGGQVKVKTGDCPNLGNISEGEACELVYGDMRQGKDQGGKVIFVGVLTEVVTAANSRPKPAAVNQ